jgi:hypothetical protein
MTQENVQGFGYGFRNPGQVIATQVIIFGTSAGLFMYVPTPGAGNLVGSWTPSGAPDQYGNTNTTAGIEIGAAGVAQVLVHLIGSNQGAIDFPTNINIESAISRISGASQGVAGHRSIGLGVFGPGLSTVGHDDIIHVLLNSANEDGTSFANIDFIYENISSLGGSTEYAYMDGSGFHILAGSANAVNPTTGLTPANPAVAETFHAFTLLAGWTQIAGQNPSNVRLLPDGNAQFVIGASHAVFAGATQIGTLPVQYRPISKYTFAAGFPGDASLELNTNGVVNAVLGTLANATAIRCIATYPLNL